MQEFRWCLRAGVEEGLVGIRAFPFGVPRSILDLMILSFISCFILNFESYRGKCQLFSVFRGGGGNADGGV